MKQSFQPIAQDPEHYNALDDEQQLEFENFSAENIKARIRTAYEIVRQFNEILDCEIVQFFNQHCWQLVPQEWRDYLMRLNVSELSLFMNPANRIINETIEMPESLIAIRQRINALSLQRNHAKYHRQTKIHSLQNNAKILHEKCEKLQFYTTLLRFDKKQAPLSFLKYKCKDKKLAEISIMSDMCFKSSLHQNVDFIVDIGAGLGHLSRCLAYFYDLNVIAIEMDEKLTKEALRLDEKFAKLLRHFAKALSDKNELQAGTIRRITMEVKPHLTMEQFHSLLQGNQHQQIQNDATLEFKFGLVGLHPCGNLAPTMLRLFKESPNCVFINLASCCYNKMNICEGSTNYKDAFVGFPLNSCLAEMTLSRNQLGLALHALESHQIRFVTEPNSFRADFYRALVEKFIRDYAPEHAEKRRRNVKTIGENSAITFKQYIQHSLDAFTTDNRIDDALLALDEASEFHKILAFSALRHLFAPLIETIVLLDRLLFIKSATNCCHIAQRFEARVSPRVHVITAFK